jgi:integrase
MPTQKLTAKTIENAKSPETGRLELWDAAISADPSLSGSFGLRVTHNGAKSWVVMYRLDGRLKRETIGSYPAYSLLQARERARASLEMAGRGIDPVKVRKAEKQKFDTVKTVKEAVEIFIKRHVKQKNRAWKTIERSFALHVVPVLGEKPLPSVTPADIHDLLDRLMDVGQPYAANRVLAHVRKFFHWCVERQLMSEPPTRNIKPPGDEQARDRVLDNDEVKRLWSACDVIGWPFGPCFKMLVLTGQRRNEVAGIKWANIDFEKKIWTLPKEATKANRQHDIPLTPLVIEILKSVPKNSEYIFSTTGKTPVSGFSKAKPRFDKLMTEEVGKMPPWRIHDIRRTVASGMAEIGIAPHVIEKVLNHSTGQISGVAAVYNRHTYLREKTDALNAWARALESIVYPTDDNIVNLRDTHETR